MLVFLLKNGRLRLPVFLLVLVIGMELLPLAATLQCYACLGDKCKTDYKTEVETCQPLGGIDKTSCVSRITSTSASRNCEQLPFAKICAQELFKRNCITAKELGDFSFMTCTSKKASGTARQGGSDDVTPAPEPEGAFCFCEGDLCNGGEEITKVVGGGGNPSPPNPNPTTGTGGDGTGESGGGAPAPTDDKKSDNGTATGGPYSSFNTFGVLFFAVLGAFVSAGSVMVGP